MKIRALILAGGEGSRLGTLTSRRTKPAVPFAGKYRIIDFTLSNCINSGISDVMILAQYRPHSLIEHIGSGVPWDLDRNFTGGVSILTPYRRGEGSDWYTGTADAVQQNFLFIKRGGPEHILILSGDHIYGMDYRALYDFHMSHKADLTIGVIRVPIEEASRFGIVEVGENDRVIGFTEKPPEPKSNLVNMGVYLFNTHVLDRALWEDHHVSTSTHDFGRDIMPHLLKEDKCVMAYPFDSYWVDVGTIESYWSAHMDLLNDPPPFDLANRAWVVHTRTEERPPVRIASGAEVHNSMLTDGCIIAAGARVERSILGPGVRVESGAVIRESIILTDAVIRANAIIERSVVDKRVIVEANARIGGLKEGLHPVITTIGKKSIVLPGMVVMPGSVIPHDINEADYKGAMEITPQTTLDVHRPPFLVDS